MLQHLPNQLTMARIAVIPIILLLMLLEAPSASWAALVLFVLAALTDWLDGYLARKQQLVSDFGRVMDVIADKLLITAVLLVLVNLRTISGILILPAIIILMREVAVSGLREFLAEVRVRVPVSKLAKWKTASQLFALPFLIIGQHAPALIPAHLIGSVLLWVAGVLTLITGWDYLRANLQHMSADTTVSTPPAPEP